MSQRKSSWAFLGAAALFFLLILLQAQSLYRQSIQDLQAANRAGETLRVLEDVKSDFRSWELYNQFRARPGQDTAFGVELALIAASGRRHLQEFAALTRGNALQQQRATTLQGLLETRFGRSTGHAGGVDPRISATLTRLEDTQSAQFTHLAQVFERSSRRRYAFSITGFVLLSLLGVAALLRGRRLADRRAKAEAEARAAEARYRMLLENSDLALVVLDAGKTIKFVGNSALVERTTGYTLEQILGQQWPFSIPDTQPGSERRSYEYPATMADGTERWMAYRVNIVCDESGAVQEYQIVTWDVDLEKRMTLERDAAYETRDRERHMLQDIVDQLPSIVYVKDMDGRYVLVNSKTRELFGGMTQDQMLGHTLQEVGYNRATNEHFIDLDNVVLQEKRPLSAEEPHWVGGQQRWYYIVKFPIVDADGTLCYLGGVSTDITELKTKEQALVTANHEAEVARSGQEAFLAAISHELRTPLNGIMGMANLLAGTVLSEEQHDFTDTILASARNLLALINDLLDFSKIKAGKFTFERQPFRVRHTVRKALYPLQFRAEEKGISLAIHFEESLPQALVGDALRLNQVLINLVSNAVKFTARGGVTLTLSGERMGDVVVLCAKVQDTGIGIPADKLEYVFESFAQNTSGMSRQYGGTGLGLAIVKQLVELQGGSMKVESVPGEGSTFTAAIPFEIGPEKTERPESAEAAGRSMGIGDGAPLQGMSILVAEDNRINQKVARSTLEKAGAEVAVVENGRQAVEALTEANGEYDAVLLDLQMPEMDGFAAARAIRKRWGVAIPLIAMTADALKGEAERCAQAGMVGFVSKPFEPAELYDQILNAVRKGRRTAPAKDLPDATPAVLPEGPTVDLSYVEELSGGDPSYISELLGIFLDSTVPGMEKLRILLESGTDPKTIQSTAHQLKSSFGVVRLPGVLEALQAIEAAARGAAFSKEDVLPRFEEAYAILQATRPKLEAMRDGTA